MSVLADVFSSLVRVEIGLWNAVEARLRAEHALTLGRFQVLQVIGRRTAAGDVCRIQDIAGDLRVTVGGISKLVDRLEDAALCERRAHPEDRRSSLVHPTERGQELLGAAQRTVETELARLLAVLPDGDLAGLRRTLARLEHL